MYWRSKFIVTTCLAAVFLAGVPAQAKVDQVLVKQIVASHEKLREMASDVTVGFKSYRVEARVENPSDDLEQTANGMELTRSGTFWRKGDLLRADYKTAPRGTAPSLLQSLAVDSDTGCSYQFTPSFDQSSGRLEVWRKESPEDVKGFVRTTFESRIDALWSLHGTAFTDYLQRPDITLKRQPFGSLPDAVWLEMNLEPGVQCVSVFDPDMLYAHIYTQWKGTTSGVKVDKEVWLKAETVGLRILPTSMIDVACINEKCYTELDLFDPRVEQTTKTVFADGLTVNSFRNLAPNLDVYYDPGMPSDEWSKFFSGAKRSGGVPVASSNMLLLIVLAGTLAVVLLSVFVWRRSRENVSS